MLHSPSERGLASGASRSPFCRIRRTIGEYNFAGQHQQSPAPLGGGLVKAEWFVFRANEPTAHRTYAHYILTQGASGGPLAPPDGLR